MPACIDIFALDDAEKYLIFKDGRYVKMKCLRDELPAAGDTWPKLHDYYRDGDHYIAHIMRPKSSSHPLSSPSRNEFQIRAFRFYIIYRDRADYNVIQLDIKDSGHDRLGECISNSDQSILRKRKLDDSYRGGDFYLSKGSEFYVVFKESNTFLRTSSLFKKPAVQIQHHKLHKDLCNGLYYFATTNFIYAVIAADNDFVYCRTPDLQSVEKEQSAFPVHPSVAEVLRNGVPLQRRSWTNGILQLLFYTTCDMHTK